ncbi:condensation domain-containing protein, partial [Paenibacillus cisolokensis]|uniref:non-ribosomal peptide synthetase n=1 Tax=Paenibacillus cisolokensis TaxID=1658519 RepID=UPI003D2A77F7
MNSNVEKIYPLTSMQEGMLYHKLLDEASTNYVVQNTIRLTGELELGILEQSLQLLSRKHAVLRTSFFYRKIKQPRQIVLKDRQLEYSFLDISSLAPHERHAEFERVKEADLKKGFDLEKDPLMRVVVVQMAPTEYRMMWCFHHIIMDGWCMSIIVKDFTEFYNAIRKGRTVTELTREMDEASRGVAQYEDYLRWLAVQSKDRALNYWRELLSGYECETGILPLEPARSSDTEAEVVHFGFGQEASERITGLAKQLNVTVNTVIEAAWGLLLQAYNNTEEAVFGKVVSGRNAKLKGIEETVGLFINTVPVRVQRRADTSVAELLDSLQKQAVETSQYDYCSLPEIQEQSQLRGRLIQSLIAFENYYADDQSSQMDGLSMEIESLKEQTNYPISLVVFLDEVLRLELMYDPRLYRASEMEKVLRHLDVILAQMADDPDQRASMIHMLTSDEEQRILEAFNATRTEYPSTRSIQELFEEQALATPDAAAVICPQASMSYAELNAAATRIMGELRRQGVLPGQLVGIVGEKSVHMIAGILGILKSGCGYVPLNGSDPENRLRFMIEDCGLDTILCGEADLELFTKLAEDRRMIRLREVCERDQGELGQEQASSSEPSPEASSEPSASYPGQASDLAYVIYTSGTTGQPKGVLVEHQNVVRLVKNTTFVSYEGARILQTGALSFDASTFEIWGALLNGGLLVLAESEEVTEGGKLEELLVRHDINMMWMTAQLFNHMTDTRPEVFRHLQYLLVGGEKLSAKHVEAVRTRYKELRIINGYGPTENT